MRKVFVMCLCFVGMSVGLAQNRSGSGSVVELFNRHCVQCHGDASAVDSGNTLFRPLRNVKKRDDIANYIARGDEERGMPSFGGVLSGPEIRALVIYIEEMQARAASGEMEATAKKEGILSGRFDVKDVVGGLDTPWGMSFLPDGRMLVTERPGRLRIVENGVMSEPIEGTPVVWTHGQGGLLDVALHPDYAENEWVYLAYSRRNGELDGRAAGMTAIVRGRIKDGRWVDEEKIFEVPADYGLSAGVHFGTRLVFQDGYLFFSIGDRGRQGDAQDVKVPNGKIHRLHDDGRVPEDNPFSQDDGAWKSIWAYGSRNAQGLAFHPESGELWETEHGPRGGDEVNLIEKGKNYGWPVITYGMNYNGTPITDRTAAPGMEQPRYYWTPSIAVCGIAFYIGDLFPEWKNNLFAGGLASQELHRLVIENGEVVQDEIVLKGLGRIRDVGNGPDGALYLVLNGPDKIVKLVPREP